MLASSTETPRPRPPAKARRNVTGPSRTRATTPPPSYASAFPLSASTGGQHRLDTLLGSPTPALFNRVGWDLNASREQDSEPSTSSPDDLDWTTEKSREEPSQLLHKADDLIKDKENELGLTAAVCKNLYDDNVALKTKHQELLARLPASPLLSSPNLSTAPLSRTSSHYSSSLSKSNSDSMISPPPPRPRGHVRSVTVSSVEISLLADQNAELLEKLERLESDSSTSDMIGRRELKRLEKEITFLRQSLEEIQVKSEELEENAKIGHGWDAEKIVEEVWRKKQAREAKLLAMRNLGHGLVTEDRFTRDRVQSFAPTGLLFGGPSGSFSFLPSAESSNSREPTSSGAVEPKDAFDDDSSMVQSEHDIFSQLLVKIQELEDANKRIVNQQMETTSQLEAVQKETEHIAQAYETLSNPTQVTLALEMDNARLREPSRNSLVRIRSLKQDEEHRHSFLTSSRTGQRDITRRNKSRKSVVDFFDGYNSNSGHSSYSSRESSLSLSFNLPVPFTGSPWSEGHQRSFSTSSNGVASPLLASPSLPSPAPSSSFSPIPGPHVTLDNELGSDLQNWHTNTSNHHLRTTSLCDISQFSVPPSPSPISRIPRSLGLPSRDTERETIPSSMNRSALRMSVEPPTPDKTGLLNEQKSSHPASPRLERISQTIRSRTNRWLDGRLDGKASTRSRSHSRSKKSVATLFDDSPPPPSAPQRIATAVDSMMETFASTQALDLAASGSIKDSNALQLHVDRSPKKSGAGKLMLEVWLWIQFIIVALFFIYAMARKGPNIVLTEAEQRGTVATRRR